MSKFIPRNGFVAVRLNNTRKTESGIFVPDNAVTERVIKGVVVGVSRVRIETTALFAPPVVEPGQVVAFLKGNGIPVKDEEGDIILLREEEVLGVFVEEQGE